MKRAIAAIAAICLALVLLAGCSAGGPGLDAKNPVTLTMWHNFGGDMQKTMDTLIDEFNVTVGSEEGVIINVTAITSSSELQNALDMIINGDPGAPDMPDISTSYPMTAINYQSKGLIANLDDCFTPDELAQYVPSFVEEGRFGDGGLYVFPFAKSTEILYLNRTLFERFSAATGVGMDCFDTFEGIADAAMRYYEWTDGLTPDVEGDGKQFYAADSWINLAQAGARQLDDLLFKDSGLDLGSAAYRHIWDTCYTPSAGGGFAVYEGYSSDLSKTGDLVCSTGSSAGILFYGDSVTYADGRVEQVEYDILPFPVFEGGQKVAIQRGNGFMVAGGDEVKVQAAALFLKWFTAPEQNMRFVASTGYLPVTNKAFTELMPLEMRSVEDIRIKKMLGAVMSMHEQYDFFVAPTFEGFDELSRAYESSYEKYLIAAREKRLADKAVGFPAAEESAASLAAFKVD